MKIKALGLSAAAALLAMFPAAGAAEKGPRPLWLAPAVTVSEGQVNVTVDVINSGTTRILIVPRRAAQHCAALHLRVLTSPARQVVYPRGPVTSCEAATQLLRVTSEPARPSLLTPATQNLQLRRSLALPPGQYVMEYWVPGGGVEPAVSGGYLRVDVPSMTHD